MLSINGSVKSQKQTIGTSATQIPTTNLGSRKSAIIKNNSGGILYLGGADVTVAQGYPLEVGDEFIMATNSNAAIYGISESSVEVRVMEAF